MADLKYPRLSRLIASRNTINKSVLEIDEELVTVSHRATKHGYKISNYDKPSSLIRIAKLCFYRRHIIRSKSTSLTPEERVLN